LLSYSLFHNFFLVFINKFLPITNNLYQISALFFIFLVMKSIKFRVNHIIRNFHFIIIFALIVVSYFQKDYDLTLIYALVVGTLLFKNYYISVENLKKYLDLVLIIIFIIAIIELVLGNTYHQFLDIFSYYLNSRSRYSPTELEIYTQIGAYRGESNYILPFINYRVSSIFLEPLGLAYFSIICLGFYRSLDVHSNTLIEMKNNYWRYILIISLIILSDTRSSYLIFIVIFLIPKNLMVLKNSYIAIILTIISFIILVSSTAEIDSEFYRRIYPTIYSLTNLKTIFNLSKYNFGILDSGYGGIMANLGILGFIYIFSFLMNSNNSLDKKKSSIYFFNFTVLYLFYFAIFGGAIFSIKTFVLLIILCNSICFYSPNIKE
jgi:hypothetical protein